MHRKNFETGQCIGVLSRRILRIPFLEKLLGEQVCFAKDVAVSRVSSIAGWGRKPTAQKAIAFAASHSLPYVSLEDGFLRSFGTGDYFPPLSLVVDQTGIYYDSTRPSDLENMLNGPASFLEGMADDVRRARALLLEHRLSKYNHAPVLNNGSLRTNDSERVLVIDQTFGDMSVSLGSADADTFSSMVHAAQRENPDATIYIKTHPEVSSGRKPGYLSDMKQDSRTILLRDFINPLSLLEQIDRVYTVSSTMGFEALLAGKPVTCFGMPWYAGWGATDDRQQCSRRSARRSVDELFAAGYIHYPRYLNPVTREKGTIFDVIEWLRHQRKIEERYSGRIICCGFRRWKAANIKPMLSLDPARVHFVRNASAAAKLDPTEKDSLIVWGRNVTNELLKLSDQSKAGLARMEDGFVRSVGLGSDLIKPYSLVLDRKGIYFDPSHPSDLEDMLNTAVFSDKELERAHCIREMILHHKITKYNIEPHETPEWFAKAKEIVLVPGQVEDDASIRYGCLHVRTNEGLLEAARKEKPDAFIVYKPHPDVISGNRTGNLDKALQWANHIEQSTSIISCIEASDELFTMTSLSGFDALLRGLNVVTFGQPFYAGWGLTDDRAPENTAFKRRKRKLTLDELVAGTLLRYPFYWDRELRGYSSCEAVIHRIVEERSELTANGKLDKLHLGYIRRQWRKLSILVRSLF